MTRQNVQLVERTAAATAALSDQAGRLVRSVAVFHVAAPSVALPLRARGGRLEQNAHAQA
jgi:hypothetical protein